LVPLLCSIQGKVANGKDCGSAMPAAARVRLTRAGSGLPPTLVAKRATRDFVDDAGSRIYPAPTGPACCMYNTCTGETIPYLANAGPMDIPSAVLAVWPDNADIDLTPVANGVLPTEIGAEPWDKLRADRLEQVANAGTQHLASLRARYGVELWANVGGGWARVQGTGPDAYDILATTDVDGNGQREAVVFERWRNDYGVDAFGNDWSTPAYHFSCGNI
jgi:hypothetical protein